jgi:hypothetical protein
MGYPQMEREFFPQIFADLADLENHRWTQMHTDGEGNGRRMNHE